MTSVFPDDYDLLPDPAPTDTMNGSIGGKTNSEYWADVHASVRAIQAALGVQPQGSADTVADRTSFASTVKFARG